ncbi:hypothetical protein RRG08_058230 [Elysia crispata]|uniref:Uncharacterized protein n=1 Tax=Elysia crispata TaxID=231223 RepID=A0AAE0YUA2_9GAST|nr:hypothetical protein RRG08_058230 [Elysia crispata]
MRPIPRLSRPRTTTLANLSQSVADVWREVEHPGSHLGMAPNSKIMAKCGYYLRVVTYGHYYKVIISRFQIPHWRAACCPVIAKVPLLHLSSLGQQKFYSYHNLHSFNSPSQGTEGFTHSITSTYTSVFPRVPKLPSARPTGHKFCLDWRRMGELKCGVKKE